MSHTSHTSNFNSQPREGGWHKQRMVELRHRISTHSRAKAAGETGVGEDAGGVISTHSRAKAAGAAGFGRAPCASFQLTAARRRLASLTFASQIIMVASFQLTAARRRLVLPALMSKAKCLFQLTAARRRLATIWAWALPTRSFQLTAARRRLAHNQSLTISNIIFQLTAARRRLGVYRPNLRRIFKISTHSRAKAAGKPPRPPVCAARISTHSRAKAAGPI